jgi:hypothetical protein
VSNGGVERTPAAKPLTRDEARRIAVNIPKQPGPDAWELRTDAGPIDAVFINERGRLTIVGASSGRIPRRGVRDFPHFLRDFPQSLRNSWRRLFCTVPSATPLGADSLTHAVSQ